MCHINCYACYAMFRVHVRARPVHTRTDVVYTQGNPFIGAKRKRVPAVIRQTGCIIDRGIEFSLSLPVFLSLLPSRSPLSSPASLSFWYLYPLPFAHCRCILSHGLARIPRSSSHLYSLYSLTLSSSSSPSSLPSYVPLSQLDMNATRLLLMHRSICILQTGCIKSRPSARYFAVKRVIYYSIW